MARKWADEFAGRMRDFEQKSRHNLNDIAVSVKIRAPSGCFHREHSPNAYGFIDSYLSTHPSDIVFEEHESGPELLVILATATAGLTLAKSVIDLITTVIKARSEGIKKGDKPDHPLELTIRRHDGTGVKEEIVLRARPDDNITRLMIENAVKNGIKSITNDINNK